MTNLPVIRPYVKRPAPPAVSLLTEGAGVLGEHGKIAAGDPGKGLQVWVPLERAMRLLRAGKGRAMCWRGQPIKYRPDGWEKYSVRVLGLPFPPDDDEAVSALGRWRDWLASEGAAPQGSLGGSAMSLLRASLEQELWLSVPVDSAPPLRFTLGGRQELGPQGAPAEFTGRLRHFDLRAAYATVLGGLEYGGRWFKLHPGKLDEHAELCSQGAGRMMFCRARVTLAGSRPGPLVRRPRSEPQTVLAHFPEFPTRGAVQGVWTWPELVAARDHGARVKLLAGWVHVNGSPDPYPFAPWLERVERGRRMRGLAGLLAKATGNALWGQFCISPYGRRQVMYFRGGRRVVHTIHGSGGRRPAHDLSEYLTGYVRAELYRFVRAAGDRLCAAHTDGGWVDCADGWTYSDWRAKGVASRLRVLDPQVLAYVDDRGLERYVVSGWPAETAGEWFENEWTQRTAKAAA